MPPKPKPKPKHHEKPTPSGPPIVSDFEIRRPLVERKAPPPPPEGGPKDGPSAENPPLGAVVTGAKKLKEAGLTGKGVRVAVIDSGVDKDHPGFDGVVKKQVWFRGGTSLAQDDHGTHVAGTIHFVAPEAEIYDYRVFGESGSVSIGEAIDASIMLAVEDGCDVINMSLGGPYPSSSMLSAIQYAHSKGVIIVCAAGNSGDGKATTNENSWPANFTECISVAAVAKFDGHPVARFSNSNDEVDYSGVGVDVISLRPLAAGGGIQQMSGTSMASPHVAGFIAALLTEGQEKGDIRKTLTEKYSFDIGAEGTDKLTGIGFLSYLSEEECAELLPPDVTPPPGETCTIL